MENKLLWGCEADTVAMLTEYLVHHTLGAPVMMTNLDPFLMGQAALKHERIPDFPPVAAEPQNHILAHQSQVKHFTNLSRFDFWVIAGKVGA